MPVYILRDRHTKVIYACFASRELAIKYREAVLGNPNVEEILSMQVLGADDVANCIGK